MNRGWGAWVCAAVLAAGMATGTGVLAAQGGQKASAKPGKAAAAARIPAALVGSWFWGTASATRYVDSRTGDFVGNGGGGGVTYEFRADGTYRCFVIIDLGAMFPGESTQTWHEGTMRVDEATGTITLKTNRGEVTTIKGSTRKRRAFAGSYELGTKVMTFRFEKDEDGTTHLRLARKEDPKDEGRRYVRDTNSSKG
jgi:hypothetical protein